MKIELQITKLSKEGKLSKTTGIFTFAHDDEYPCDFVCVVEFAHPELLRTFVTLSCWDKVVVHCLRGSCGVSKCGTLFDGDKSDVQTCRTSGLHTISKHRVIVRDSKMMTGICYRI